MKNDIRIYMADVRDVPSDMYRNFFGMLSEPEKNRLFPSGRFPEKDYGSERARRNIRLRLTAHALLTAALPGADIRYTDDGRPYVYDAPSFTDISLTHEGDFCAVAVANGRIGIDLQSMEKTAAAEAHAAGLSARFSFPAVKNADCAEISFFKAFFADGSIRFSRIGCPTVTGEQTDTEVLRFLFRWTRMEAVMKCDGRGFGCYADLKKDTSAYCASTFSLCEKEKNILISVAEKI